MCCSPGIALRYPLRLSITTTRTSSRSTASRITCVNSPDDSSAGSMARRLIRPSFMRAVSGNPRPSERVTKARRLSSNAKMAELSPRSAAAQAFDAGRDALLRGVAAEVRCAQPREHPQPTGFDPVVVVAADEAPPAELADAQAPAVAAERRIHRFQAQHAVHDRVHLHALLRARD